MHSGISSQKWLAFLSSITISAAISAPSRAQFGGDPSAAMAADPTAQAGAATAGATAGSSAARTGASAAGSGVMSPDGTYGLKEPEAGRAILGFDEAMRTTVRNNLDLRLAQEQMFQAELLIRKAWSTVLPRLNGNVAYTFSWPRQQFQTISQEALDKQTDAAKAQLEGQAQIYDAQAAAAHADGDYNTEFANRSLAARLRQQESAIAYSKAPDPIAISPVNMFTGGLAFTLVLFNGRAIPLLFNAYDTVKQTRANMVRARSQALYMVALGYFNATSARRLVGISEKQVENLRHHLNVTKVRVETGVLPRLALKRAEADVERATAAVRSAKNAYNSAVASLGQTMGLDTMFDVGGLPPIPLIEEGASEEDLQARARANRPDYQAVKMSVTMAERSRIDAMMRWMPTVSLAANTRATSNIQGFVKEPITYSVTLNASVPLYDGGDRYTAWLESGSQIRAAKIQLEQMERKLNSAVRGNLREIKVRKENLSNQRLALSLAEDAAKDARTRFDVGNATQLEVLDAEQLAVSAALDLALAELELQTARLALAFVTGSFNPAVGDTESGQSPVDLSMLPVSAVNTDISVAHLSPDAPAQAPRLAPAHRAAQLTPGSGVSLQPSAFELIRSGIAAPTPNP